MDISTNKFQSMSAALVSLTPANSKQSVDSAVKNTGDAMGKTELQSPPSGAFPVTKTEDMQKPDDLKQAVTRLNDYVQNIQRDLQFSIDKESGAVVVKVIDANSKTVIRQIPAEETLRLARNLAAQEKEAAFTIFNTRA